MVIRSVIDVMVSYTNMHGASGGFRDVLIIVNVIGRSCAASIITRSSWYGIVITRIAANRATVTVTTGRYYLYVNRYHPYGQDM